MQPHELSTKLTDCKTGSGSIYSWPGNQIQSNREQARDDLRWKSLGEPDGNLASFSASLPEKHAPILAGRDRSSHLQQTFVFPLAGERGT
jgi:hypothetical protein